MPVLDLSAYKPVPATLGDANQVANGMQAIQNCINALDNNNFAAGRIFDPAKLMQNAAVDGDAMVWDNTNSKWVPASAMPAASVKPGLYKLWDSVDAGVSLPAASITTPTLSQAFKHLHVEFTGRDSGAVAFTRLQMRFNGDATAGNYVVEGFETNAGTITRFQLQSSAFNVFGYTGSTAAANLAGYGTVKIADYTRTVFEKALLATGGALWLNTSGSAISGTYNGFWNSTAAVTSLTFITGSTSFGAGTRITVYGEA